MNRRSLIRSRLRTGGRTLSTEALESRVLLAGDMVASWQNSIDCNDVNQDGMVTGLDAIQVIREINVNGPRELGARPAGEPGDTSNLPLFDTNGDGYLSPIDARQVINALNAPQGEGEVVAVRMQLTDLEGDRNHQPRCWR